MVYPILRSILGEVFSNSTNSPFSAADAKQDNIAINLSEISLIGDTYDRVGLLEVISSLHTEFFTRVQGRRGTRELNFRRSTSRYAHPSGLSLLAGYIKTRPSGEAQLNISADLNLNPTRFFRHHYSPRGLGAEMQPSMLLGRGLHHSSGEEHVLDGNDNCLLGIRPLTYAFPDAFSEYRNRYLRYAFSFVQDVVRDATPHGVFAGTPRYNLRTVETYWERACEFPIQFVDELAQRFRSYRAPFRAMAYLPPSSHSRYQNSVYCSLPIKEGVTLNVYAKTNMRVRFEIKHDLTRLNDPDLPRHTSVNFDELLLWIDILAQKSAEAINRVDVIQRPPLHSEFELSAAYDLMEALAYVTDRREDALRILDVLISLDSYSVSSPERSVFDELARRGILERRGRTMMSLRPRFMPVAALLRSRISRA